MGGHVGFYLSKTDLVDIRILLTDVVVSAKDKPPATPRGMRSDGPAGDLAVW